MKTKLKLITVAMLGVVFSGMLLAGISAHAEVNLKESPAATERWDSVGHKGGGHIRH